MNIIKRIKRFSINKLMVLFSLSSVFVMLVVLSSVLYGNVRSYMSDKIEDVSNTRSNQVAAEIDSSFSQVTNALEYMKSNKTIITYIKDIENENTDIYEKHVISQKFVEYIKLIVMVNPLVKSINILTEKSNYSSNLPCFQYGILWEGKDKIDKPVLVMPERGCNTYLSEDSLNLEQIKNYMHFKVSLYDENEVYGIIYVLLDSSYLKERANDGSHTLIFDKDDNFLWSDYLPDNVEIEGYRNNLLQSSANTVFKNSGKSIAMYKGISFNGWKVVYTTEIRDILNKIYYLRYMLAAAFLLSLFVSFIFSKLVSDWISRPLKNLTGFMEDYEPGESEKFNNVHKTGSVRRISYKERVFYYFIAAVLIPLCLYIIIFYVQSKSIMEDEAIRAQSLIFEKSYKRVNEYLNGKFMALQKIAFSRLPYEIWNSGSKGFDAINEEVLNNSRYFGLGRENIIIYDKYKNILYSDIPSYQMEADWDFYNKVENAAASLFWKVGSNSTNRSIVTLMLPAMSLDQYSKPLGYARLDIDCIDIMEHYLELKSNYGIAYIIDKNGSVISHSGSNNILMIMDEYTGQFDKRIFTMGKDRFVVFKKKFEGLPWYFIYEYDYKDVLKQSSIMFTNNIYIFIILLLFVVILSYVFSYIVLNPVNSLIMFSNSVNLDNLDEQFKMAGIMPDEISVLGNTFNNMLERIENLIDELIRSNMAKQKLENEKKDAEIIAFQAQINPHFLYNTLDTINYMIKEKMNEDASEMLNSLSSLFRLAISREEYIIAINEEIQYAKAYTSIINKRYNNRIEFEWNIDEKLLNYKTLKLVLQPVIENAIYHGIRKKNGVGIIKTSCSDKGQYILFAVEDDGVGIELEELDNIRKNLLERKQSNKVGIYNVHSRIILNFGSGYGVDIKSSHKKGTAVYISIPKVG